jgi:hypothetical protein
MSYGRAKEQNYSQNDARVHIYFDETVQSPLGKGKVTPSE